VPAPTLLAITALSLALPLLAWALFSRPSRAHVHAVANLQRGIQPAGVLLDLPSTDRRGRGSSLVLKLIPASNVQRMHRLAAAAGRPADWPIERLLTGKLVAALGGVVVGLLFVFATGRAWWAVGVMVGLVVLGYLLPEVLLYNTSIKRKQTITLELADTLDQMTVAVEAGLGFESAMAQAGRNGSGPLAEELVRTLQDIEMGQTRRQAYEALAARTGVDDLRRFVRAVTQADNNGIPIADVLRVQASEMRLKRRQRAEEKAMQMPVKVIFPLLLCILPVLFIVVMGPAAMDIVNMFSGF